MANEYVIFLEQPSVGSPFSFILNGQTMTSSPVMTITPDPMNPDLLTILTASGSRYTGRYQPGYQPTMYATQYGQTIPPPQVPPQGTYEYSGNKRITMGNERIIAAMCHISALFSGIIGPLIIYLIAGKDSALVDHHGKETLNFQLTILLASLFLVPVIIILVVSIVGILLIPFLSPIGIAIIVFKIYAAVKANAGEYYSYPIAIHFIR